jgi:hypothetical protein
MDKSSLNLTTVLKKQSQFTGGQMDVTYCFTMNYEDMRDSALGENKPKTKPSAGLWPEAGSAQC